MKANIKIIETKKHYLLTDLLFLSVYISINMFNYDG